MDKITILYVTDVFCRMAGAEGNLFEVTTRLNKQKYKPIVICFQGGEIVAGLKDKGIEVIDLKLKRIYVPRALIKMLFIFHLIKQKKVKIVVTYHESSDFLVSITAKLAGVPVIISSRRDMGYNLKKRHIYIYKSINKLFDRVLAVSDAVKNKITGKVLVNFTVTGAGKIKNVAVSKSVSPLLDAEAIRVIGSMPEWKPAMQGGKPVDVQYCVPVEFKLK